MKERKLSDNASCFLIKDDRLKENWHSTPIYAFLEQEGFSGAKVGTNLGCRGSIDWLYVNIYSKVFAKGRAGIGLAPVVGNHAITFDEFVTIYNIYKKYEGFSTLKMTQREQDEFEKMSLRIEMKKIIGCTELTHEILDEYLSRGWWEREMLPWEHCAMRFQTICGPMRKEYVTQEIHSCHYRGNVYYFGLGLDEPEITDDMIKHGVWLVYTWSD